MLALASNARPRSTATALGVKPATAAFLLSSLDHLLSDLLYARPHLPLKKHATAPTQPLETQQSPQSLAIASTQPLMYTLVFSITEMLLATALTSASAQNNASAALVMILKLIKCNLFVPKTHLFNLASALTRVTQPKLAQSIPQLSV